MSELTAEGLLLRGWADGDMDALLAIHRDPELRSRLRRPLTTADEATAWIAAQREDTRTGTRVSYAVLDDDRLAGCVVLKDRHEIGYWTAAHSRGRDVAPRAVRALAAWACGEGVTELEIRHQIDNEASCRVAEKAGFPLRETLPATPPWPLPGHVHTRGC